MTPTNSALAGVLPASRIAGSSLRHEAAIYHDKAACREPGRREYPIAGSGNVAA
jgi:hypothetical protein